MTDTERANKISIEIAQKYDKKEIVGYECAMMMAQYKNEEIKNLNDWIRLLAQRLEAYEKYVELQ